MGNDNELCKSTNTFILSYTVSHSFVLDGEGIEYKIVFKISSFHEVPGWRNWQTQRAQETPVGFPFFQILIVETWT
jgi:hypothetical protein